jgi:microcompartment protein CcmL/EutN
MTASSLGFIETKGLVGAVEAADAASKAATVIVSSAELNSGSMMTIRIEGKLADVQAAVEAGARAAERVGHLVAAHVIARPYDGLERIITDRRYISKYHPEDNRTAVKTSPELPRVRPPIRRPAPRPTAKPKIEKPPVARPVSVREQPAPQVAIPEPQRSARPTRAELEALPVVKLRQFARGIENLPIKGRQISMANKSQLLEAIGRVVQLS